jgi:hypothetical protein
MENDGWLDRYIDDDIIEYERYSLSMRLGWACIIFMVLQSKSMLVSIGNFQSSGIKASCKHS